MLEVMSRNGYRITEQRQTLLAIVIAHEGCMSPKDIYVRMIEKFPGVSFDTVYRNLRILKQLGLVEQFYFMDSGLKFKASCNSHHYHHLICQGCESIVPIENCPLERLIHLPENYKILYHRFEIYGLCEQCQ
nr:Fur family transcriptional regulator [Paenibacillus sp. ATY16]